MKSFEYIIKHGNARVNGHWFSCNCGQGGRRRDTVDEATVDAEQHMVEHGDLISFSCVLPGIFRRRFLAALGPMVTREIIDIQEVPYEQQGEKDHQQVGHGEESNPEATLHS